MDLATLKAQQAALAEQIKAAESAIKAQSTVDLATVRDLVAKHGFERKDIFPLPELPAKYRDPVTGAVWTGRGYKPKWLEAKLKMGVPLETFAI